MKIRYGVITSTVIESTDKELNKLKDILTPDTSKKDDIPETLLTEDNIFYSGLLRFIQKRLPVNFNLEIVDPIDFGYGLFPEVDSNLLSTQECPDFALRDYQQRVISKALYAGRGLLELATGAGKTEIAAGILKQLLLDKKIYKALYVVGSSFLLEQAYDRFKLRGLNDLGKVGGGNRKFNHEIVLGLTNSLHLGLCRKNKDIIKLVNEADCIIFDEAHHLGSASWVNIASKCKAKWRYGLSGTLWDDPGKYTESDYYLMGMMGPRVTSVPASYLIKQGYLAEPIVCMVTNDKPKVKVNPAAYQAWAKTYNAGIVNSKNRNTKIVKMAEKLYNSIYKTMIFINRISHGKTLLKEISKLFIEECIFVYGGNTVLVMKYGSICKEEWSLSKVADFVNNNERCIVIGSTVLDEGVDIPAVNALIMGAGMKKYRRTIQRVGRGLRPKEGSNKVFVFDFMDNTHPFLKSHSNYRVKTYDLEGFTVCADEEIQNYLGFNN